MVGAGAVVTSDVPDYAVVAGVPARVIGDVRRREGPPAQRKSQRSGDLMIRVGVIGFGYWGLTLVRNFAEAKGARVVRVSDTRRERLDIAAKRYPGIQTTDNALELIHAPDVDAVVLATPVSSHFPLALEALRAGKHVLVEKPLASTLKKPCV